MDSKDKRIRLPMVVRLCRTGNNRQSSFKEVTKLMAEITLQSSADRHVLKRAAVRNASHYFLPVNVNSRFGLRLRQLRRERHLTQLRMAIDFGIDRTFISDVERGRKSISLAMLEIIALGLQLSLSDLLKDI